MPRRNSKQTVRTTVTVAGNGKRRTTTTTTSKPKPKTNPKRNRRRIVSRTRLIATQAHRVTTRRGGANRTVIRGSEIVNSIKFRLQGTQDAIFSLIPINPCYWKGTNIAQQAANYSAYRPLSIRYRYIPQVSVNHNGSVQIGTLWDTSVSSDSLSQTLMTSPGGKFSQCYDKFSNRIPLSGLQQKLFNCNGELKQSTNPFFIVGYNRGAVSLTDDDEIIIPGTIIIDYVYAFYNKLGSNWIYGRINAVNWADGQIDKSHANMSLVTRTGAYPPVTTLDIDDGELKYNGTRLSTSAAQTIIGDIYWNDPSPNTTEGITLYSGDLTLQYLTDIQYTTDLADGWTTIDTYYGPMSYDMVYGMPGYLTVMVCPVNILDNTHEKYNLSMQVWIGAKKISKTVQDAFNGGMFCYIPFTKSTYVRGVSNLGHHSNLLYVNWTWASAITLTSDPPSYVVCPPWAEAKLEDHHEVLPEEDAPTEEDYPNGMPYVQPDPSLVIDKSYCHGAHFIKKEQQILQPGVYYAFRFNGSVPFVAKQFTISESTLYDPQQLPDDYYVGLGTDAYNALLHAGTTAYYSNFPTMDYDYTEGDNDYSLEYTPSLWEANVYVGGKLFKPTTTNSKWYSYNPTSGVGVYLKPLDGDEEEEYAPGEYVNLLHLPEPPQSCTVTAEYKGIVTRFLQITTRSTTNNDVTTTVYSDVLPMDARALPRLPTPGTLLLGFVNGQNVDAVDDNDY